MGLQQQTTQNRGEDHRELEHHPGVSCNTEEFVEAIALESPPIFIPEECIDKGVSSFSSFKELVAWVSEEREGLLHAHLLYDVNLIDFSPPTITLRISKKAPQDLPQKLQNLIKKKKNEVWTIAISDEIGHPTLHEQEQKAQEERREAILQDPLVKTLMESFPDAILLEITDT